MTRLLEDIRNILIPYMDTIHIFTKQEDYINYNPEFIENGLRCHISSITILSQVYIRVDFMNIHDNLFRKSGDYVKGNNNVFFNK